MTTTEKQPNPLAKTEEVLVKIQEQARELPSKTDLQRNERRMNRSTRVLFLAFGLVLMLQFLFSGFLYGRQAGQEAAQQINRASIESINQENVSRMSEGLAPIPVPNIQNDEINIDALISARIAAVSDALRNDPNLVGLTGAPGIQGIQGPMGAPCLPSIPECRGPEGEEGQPGINGIDGEDGEDSTVAGPPGINGIDGETGQPGRGVISFQPEVTDNGCEFVTRYDDGTSTGVPADVMFCAAFAETPPVEEPPVIENP